MFRKANKERPDYKGATALLYQKREHEIVKKTQQTTKTETAKFAHDLLAEASVL